MGNKLSDGFGGATTRKFDGFHKKVESRLDQSDMFKEEFRAPGTKELGPGMDPTKRDAPYSDQHEDQTVDLMAAHKENEAYKILKELEYNIKQEGSNPYDKFDGYHENKKPAGDNQKNDPHQTDPNLSQEEDQEDDEAGEGDGKGDEDNLSNPGPEKFNKEVEKRMKRLATGKLIKTINNSGTKIKIYQDTSIFGKKNYYSYEFGGIYSGGFKSIDEAVNQASIHLFDLYRS